MPLLALGSCRARSAPEFRLPASSAPASVEKPNKWERSLAETLCPESSILLSNNTDISVTCETRLDVDVYCYSTSAWWPCHVEHNLPSILYLCLVAAMTDQYSPMPVSIVQASFVVCGADLWAAQKSPRMRVMQWSCRGAASKI